MSELCRQATLAVTRTLVRQYFATDDPEVPSE